jgi:hypothetical protein
VVGQVGLVGENTGDMRRTLVFGVAVVAFAAAVVSAQRRDAFVLSRDHPAVRYMSSTTP